MSIWGDLLSFGGSYLADREQAKAQNKLAQSQASQQQYERGTIEAGQVDAFGNVLNKRDPATGSYTTTLTPKTQELADTALSNTLGAEQRRGGFGDIAGDLQNQFRGTQIEGPLDRNEAMGMVNLDNQRMFNSVIDPIANKIAMQTQRTMGNTSNAPQYAQEATSKILPAIQMGGEQQAMALSNNDMDRFIKQTLQLSEAANNASVGQNIAIPGVVNTGGVANALNAVGQPTVMPISSSSAAFNALARGGSMLNANESAAANTQMRQDLLGLLERQIGNQTV